MKFAVFKVSALDPEPDTQRLNTFLCENSVLQVEREFVVDGSSSFWSFCISIADAPVPATDGRARKPPRVDYREVLPPEIFARYARLRELRNTLAKQRNTPPYAIFTNEQIAAMAQLEEPSRAAMAGIDGVGEKRLADYADVFLNGDSVDIAKAPGASVGRRRCHRPNACPGAALLPGLIGSRRRGAGSHVA